SPASITPALTSSSLYLPIAANSSWLGITPASLSGLALTMTMKRIALSSVDWSDTTASNDRRRNRQAGRRIRARSAIIGSVAADEAARPLLIVDGDNLAHRAYHSTPKTVVGAGGAPINAVVGVVNMLVNLWQRERPRAIFVAWDTLGVETYRHRLLPSY